MAPPKNRILRAQTPLTLLLLALALLLPRWSQLDSYVTVDERHWLVRSANFAQAWTAGDYKNTFQQGHPGVTVMWLGTLGYRFSFPEYATVAPGQFSYSSDAFDEFVTQQGHRSLDLLVAGRRAVVVANTLLLLLAWWLARSLLRHVLPQEQRYSADSTATLALMLIALHPFLVGHSRLLHPDSLLWTLMFVSVLGYLGFVVGQGQARQAGDTAPPLWGQARQSILQLGISGLAAGLAWLTKTPGFYLVPFVGLLWVVGLLGIFRKIRANQSARPTLLRLFAAPLLWLPLSLITVFVLWPALWVAPTGTVAKMFSISRGYAAEGHDSALFFAGKIVNGDPGFWFYPITYLWRASPLDLLGLGVIIVGAGIALIRRAALAANRQTADADASKPLPNRRPQDALSNIHEKSKQHKGITTPEDHLSIIKKTEAENRLAQLCLLLLIFGLGFWLFMNLGAKKFDRYLLPAYAPLTVAAAVSLNWVISWFAQWENTMGHIVGLLSRKGLVVIQGALLLLVFPTYLSYYNPVMGGADTAPQAMFIGWGQGLAEAADYINADNKKSSSEKSGQAHSPPKVATWYGRGPLSYFLDGDFLSSHYYWQAEYNVVYANQLQRQAPARQLMAYWNRFPPSYIATLNGIDYAQVYRTEQMPLPRFVADWNGQIRLISYTLNAGVLKAGQELQLELYLQNLAPINTNLNMLVRIVNMDGSELLRSDRWPFGSATSNWQRDELWVDRFNVKIPANVESAEGAKSVEGAKSGLYRVEIRFYDPSSMEGLPVVEAVTGNLLGETHILDYVEILAYDENVEPDDELMPNVCHQDRNNATDVLLGESIRLAEHRVPTQSMIPGRSWQFLLCWQSLLQPSNGYTAFAHLVGPDGQLAGQQDKRPLDGFLPMQLWYPGLTVADRFEIPLPQTLQPGSYRLLVGMYDAKSGERLPITVDGTPMGDAYEVATVTR